MMRATSGRCVRRMLPTSCSRTILPARALASAAVAVALARSPLVAVAAPRRALPRLATTTTTTTTRPFASGGLDQWQEKASQARATHVLNPPTPSSVVITAAGPDRPGIVASLSALLQGGNIEESRMTMLGNDFALILLATLPTGMSADKVRTSIQEAFPEFIVSARQTSTAPLLQKEPARILHIELEGADQPGLMSGLTKIFADFGVSVRDLDTDTSSAPFAGYRIFSLKSVVAVPKSCDQVAFTEALKRFESETSADIRIDDPDYADDRSSSDESDHEPVRSKRRHHSRD